MKSIRFAACGLALVALVVAPAFGADRWIHVRVDEGDDGDRVTVNLPITLVTAAAALIPDHLHRESSVVFDDLELDWEELKTFLAEVKAAPEATFVTVRTDDETVEVRKEGDFIFVDTSERSENGADVDVKVPLAVFDALLSGPPGELDLEAAIRALTEFGPGSLVSVRDGDDTTVDVWIDERQEAD